MAESESHVLNIRCHVLKIVTAVTSFHYEFATLLSESHFVAMELSTLLQKLGFDMEFVFCIDRVLASFSILADSIVEDIEGALATSVTTVIFSRSIWCIALVSCSMKSVSIGLLDIKLGAPMASNLVSIAVLERV